ncbi:hypothetical protein P4132_12645 [Pseudomonas aeruginosa]|nr:hypothetical protein [Pseudomonas aeruginosa]
MPSLSSGESSGQAAGLGLHRAFEGVPGFHQVGQQQRRRWRQTLGDRLEEAPLGLVAAQEMQHQQDQRRIARRRRR